jgi:PIN domain nuclease of toxin-antitoxin system
MKLLLDTHAFLWWLSDPKLLATPAAAAIADPQNQVLISVAVLWEIAIKRAIGKLIAPIDFGQDVARAGFSLLPIEVSHVEKTEQLAVHHRDPFDRMLIAQAMVEGATIISRDPAFSAYPVALIVA